ncbi:MAG: cupin domain-containing protein [Pelagibacteraceae bacterium]|jgi:sialic acid synthase SpsE/mannose-6-phosphate isomerase-like protein (cupin superfamily)|nr:cupin domain-containing protein [Pelagibacteraceae bacterium]
MNSTLPENLVILEIANNHMGDVQHGINLIKEYSKVCKKYPHFNYAFKLQYRQLDTFIHEDFKERFDLGYIKRFQETRLNKKDFDLLVNCIKDNNNFAMVTAFDNESYNLIKKQPIDIIKIASCSFGDWPLLDSAAQLDLPIIASTAGANLETIDNVISFLSNRDKSFAIMHCVAQYPTPDKNMNLSQIDFLKKRYSDVRVGFSTHEDPGSTDMIKIAIAKGADIFEKHIALPTEEYPINKYSVNPVQFEDWLKAASFAQDVCGVGDKRILDNKDEQKSLKSLQRGVFFKDNFDTGHVVNSEDVYFAFPSEENQYTANDFSKYSSFTLTKKVIKNQALSRKNSKNINSRQSLEKIVNNVRKIVSDAGIKLPNKIPLEISHHYGIEKFDNYGMCIFTLINRTYCKKLLICFAGQKHPEQYHEKKEETFRLLYGDASVILDGKVSSLSPGDIITVEKEVRHEFSSKSGSIIEEISDTHHKDDSYYTDESINQSMNRKTHVTFFSN